MGQPALWNFREMVWYWIVCICPEVALVLSLWLHSGWSGLLLHWRADLSAACRVRRLAGNGQKGGTSE
jgi:hypothetical protein